MIKNHKIILALCFSLLIFLTCSPSVNNVWFPKKLSNKDNLKILILGNSITGAPPIGQSWTEGWGLAASSPEKDYVHVLYSYFQNSLAYSPQLITYDLRQFEYNFSSFDFSGLAPLNQFNADLIIIRIGDNIETDISVSSYLWDKFDALLQYLSQNPNQTIVCTSSWYTKITVNTIMREVCRKRQISFIDISYLYDDKSNQASSERAISDKRVGSHPGDKGMKKIADILWENIVNML
jgi:hypothetical protein